MTAELSQDWAPGYMLPGARPFENMPDDLELVGVQLHPAQIDLLGKAAVFRPSMWRTMYVLTAYALPDPVFPHAEGFGIPAFDLDEATGESKPVVIPAIAEVDCSEWETFDEAEPFWRRNPSILARRHVYSAVTGTLVEGLTPLRIWDCWPLTDEYDADLVKQATASWFSAEWKPYLAWLSCRDNLDVTLCDAYEDATGLPESQHQHEYDSDGYVALCREGEAWFEWFGKERIVLDEDGDPYPRPFKPVGGLDVLGPVWQHLLASSEANTKAALTAYPPWERGEVMTTERHYSPWLWSS